MNEKYIIVDNFYSDPDMVRKIALESKYSIPPGNNSNWAGNSTENSYVMPGLDSYLSKRTGKMFRAQYPLRNGYFRKALQGDATKSYVHVDTPLNGSNASLYTGVLYLTPNEYSKGKPGTNFFKHKPTGLHKIESYNDITFTLRDSYNPDLWELTESIEMLYNRLLLIHVDYFHGPADSFGDNDLNCSYKQIFSFALI